MIRNNTRKISEIIKDYLKETNIENKLKEVEAIKLWKEILGKTIAHKTKSIKIKDGILYVKIDSPVVKHQLSLMSQAIIEKINQQLDDDVIKYIVFK